MTALAATLFPAAGASAPAEGMDHLRNAAGDAATVSLYGGQVLSWCTATGGEQLYCSPQAVAGQGRAIRGGVPVCFPQFANCGPIANLAKHGFARTSMWQLAGELITGSGCETASARFVLQDSALTLAAWPYGFSLELQLTLGSGWLELQLQVMNTGVLAFDFTAALHTYLATTDVRQAVVYGLEGIAYADALKHNETATQADTALQFVGELDRVYLDTPPALQLQQSGQPHLCIEQQGFADTVVWNPGPAKAAALGDMPAADWTRMLCIEAAQVKTPVQLQPGNMWQGAQRLIHKTHKKYEAHL
jgi:glucose-6-phosphate 1-epimerase